MNERMRESLSALMDDEANELELERILSQLGTNIELRQTWTRYNIAQQTLHGHQRAHLDWDISTRVQSALAGTQVDVMTGPHARGRSRFLRPLVSFGVAASVALTVVVGGRQILQMGNNDNYIVDGSVSTSSSPVGMLGAAPVQASFGAKPVPVLQPATRTAYQDLAQQRLRRYMQEHAEQAALNSPQGLVPFARVPEIRE
jgi:sigma-E factor negative regulatory protein RseA